MTPTILNLPAILAAAKEQKQAWEAYVRASGYGGPTLLKLETADAALRELVPAAVILRLAEIATAAERYVIGGDLEAQATLVGLLQGETGE